MATKKTKLFIIFKSVLLNNRRYICVRNLCISNDILDFKNFLNLPKFHLENIVKFVIWSLQVSIHAWLFL
jgi:hypothetical protein